MKFFVDQAASKLLNAISRQPFRGGFAPPALSLHALNVPI